jgi:hypothetical protein
VTPTRPAALAFLLATAAAAAQEAATPPAADPDAAVRAARLSSQRAELEAEIAAMEAFGHEDELIAKLSEIVDAPDRDQKVEAVTVPIRDDELLYYAHAEFFVRWHRPLPARTIPAFADVTGRYHPYPTILDFRDQLRSRGIELLVVTIPSRFEIYPELLIDLPEGGRFVGMGSGVPRFLLALNEAGIETLDLRPAFAAARFAPDDKKDQLFLRGDPHWTPRAAELAARLVAERVTTLPWFARGPLKEGKDFRVEGKTVELDGRNQRNPRDPFQLKERPQVVAARSVVTESGDFDALSERSRFVVVGDSFTDFYDWAHADFTTHLVTRLGHKVDLVEATGGAARETRKKLARWEPARWRNRKLVIWCFSAGTLVCDDRWEPIELFPK